MDRAELEKLDRESLVQRAQAAGLKRARVLTRPELIDELVRLNPQIEPSQLKRSRGFFGLARDLLSRVVERGLHLPDAAERFRQALTDVPQVPRPEPQAIPTVTLAEIYASQGHQQRAVDTLKRVLENEPDHVAARALLEKLEGKDYVPPREPLPPEPEYEPPTEELEEPEEPEEPDLDEEAAIETPRLVVEDRCIAISCGGAYVWWQLSAASQKLAEESFFFVRVVSIVPTWDGPQVSTRDVAADPSAGELVLRDLPERAVVRVAIGFMADGELVPVAHSPALELGPDQTVSQWTLDAVTPSVLGDPLVVAAAQRAAQRI